MSFGVFHLKAPNPASWKKVGAALLATFGLGLALASALASGEASRLGRTSVAVTLAGLALGLAAIVAITVVPALFRRATREWPVFSFHFTVVGWIYLLVVGVVAVAAFNTGNNLLFIVLSAALSLLLVSGVITGINLYGLELTADFPTIICAQQTFPAVLKLHNRKQWVPAFSLGVEAIADQGRGNSSVGRESPAEVLAAGHQGYLLFLPRRATSRLEVWLRLPHRGWYRQDQVEVTSQFPFGFVQKRRRIRLNQEVLALPEIAPPNQLFELLPRLNGAMESYFRGWGSDLYSIRDYSPWDNARFLDWKATAKTGMLKTREMSKDEDRRCILSFDNQVSAPERLPAEAFEKAVTLCANLARHLHSMDCEIRLVTREVSTEYCRSEEGLLNILKILALIYPVEGRPQEDLDSPPEREFTILFTSRSTDRNWSPSQVTGHVVPINDL